MTPRKPALLPSALLLSVLGACPAFSHVSLERGETQKGAPYKAVIKVPHGCDGSATTAIKVELPEGFIGAKPMPKAGWKLDLVRGAYAQTYAFYHGAMLSEGVKDVTWSGGNLPDDYYDEFVVSGFVAKELTAGTSLAFKVTQTCEKGEMAWDQVPAAGEDAHHLEHPAAILKIAADDSGASNGGAKGVTIGSLVIEDAWARATPEGASVGAGYLSIRNTGSAADTLISVETDVAKRAEIHEMTMTDGVMRMRRLENGLEIPAGGTATLKPGGNHLMLLGLTGPLVEGKTFAVKLGFKSGATGEITLQIKGLGADGGGGEDHEHHH